MSDEKNYITPEGAAKLRGEYEELSKNERPKLVEVVAWAASNGDRSENADYQYGKKRLREIDSRLRFLRLRLENAEEVDPSKLKTDKVVFGARVTIENADGEVLTYQIVGEDEFNLEMGKISWKSPMAKTLLGKKVDDEVLLKKPSGEEYLTILKIEYK